MQHSDTAIARKINNTMPKTARKNYEAMTAKVLDPLRERWGSPILVSSGYRCQELNKAVGGVSDSYHLGTDDHAAVDLIPKNGDLNGLYKLIKAMAQRGEITVDKVLFEQSKTSKWIHLQWKRNAINRGIFVDRYVV